MIGLQLVTMLALSSQLHTLNGSDDILEMAFKLFDSK